MNPDGVRLQKVLAGAGVASRRVCENYILAGRVRVNGKIVTTLGTRIDPVVDLVEVDNTPIQLDASRKYVLLNKPRGVVSSLNDELGRPDLSQYVEKIGERVFSVGRLDAETTGLLLLTNDGSLAHVLAHPSFGVQKSYLATVRGQVRGESLRSLHAGIVLADGPIRVDRVRIVGESAAGRTLVKISLHSGRNRIVRRMFAAIGHPVLELVRRSFGPLHLGSLPLGRTRELDRVEVGELLDLARKSATANKKADRKGVV